MTFIEWNRWGLRVECTLLMSPSPQRGASSSLKCYRLENVIMSSMKFVSSTISQEDFTITGLETVD